MYYILSAAPAVTGGGIRAAGMKKRKLNKYDIDEGLRFECVPDCVKCCAIPGLVFVRESEIPAMAKYFKMTPGEFIVEHLSRYWADIYQINMPDDEPCKFLSETGCGIYPARPAQCSSFPFWPENISNPAEWKKMKKICPGIDRGRLFKIDEIIDIMATVSFGPFL
jgi:uncharacterized protein